MTIQAIAALALVGLAAAEWYGTVRTDRLAEQRSQEQVELKEFHASLVAKIQNLADQSGMLTSADLCPVRFRLRFDNGIGYPHSPIVAELIRPGPPSEVFEPQFNPATGTAHFGLLRPGNYRLNIRLYDAYELNHDFDLLPGVPVDRLVLCPNADPVGCTVAVDVALPRTLQERGLVLLAHLCRDSLALDGWNWSAVDPGETTVVAASSESDANRLAQLLADSGVTISRLSPNAPYMLCRLTGLTVLHFDDTKTERPEELASFQFMDADELPRITYSPPRQTTILDQSSPRYQGNPLEVPMRWRWTIDLPSTARKLLEDRLGVSTKVEAARSEPMPL